MRFMRPEEVPEGYTYRRCDLKTSEELEKEFRIFGKYVKRWLLDHPKDQYDISDVRECGEYCRREKDADDYRNRTNGDRKLNITSEEIDLMIRAARRLKWR